MLRIGRQERGPVHVELRKLSLVAKQATRAQRRAFKTRECEKRVVGEQGAVLVPFVAKLAHDDTQDAEHIATGTRDDDVVQADAVVRDLHEPRKVGTRVVQ